MPQIGVLCPRKISLIGLGRTQLSWDFSLSGRWPHCPWVTFVLLMRIRVVIDAVQCERVCISIVGMQVRDSVILTTALRTIRDYVRVGGAMGINRRALTGPGR